MLNSETSRIVRAASLLHITMCVQPTHCIDDMKVTSDLRQSDFNDTKLQVFLW